MNICSFSHVSAKKTTSGIMLVCYILYSNRIIILLSSLGGQTEDTLTNELIRFYG
jgi:hypothetical protein